MKIYLLSSPFNHLVWISLIFFICSCSSGRNDYTQSGKPQPGYEISYLINKEEIKVSSMEQYISSYFTKNRMVKLDGYSKEATLLLKSFIELDINESSFTNLNEESDPERLVYTLLSLYPIDSYNLVNKLEKESGIDKNVIRTAAIEAGLDPSLLFSATSSGVTHRITPLIESVGIVLYNQNESTTHEVRYRDTGGDEWYAAMPLNWDPINMSAVGSIVDLLPSTNYEIEIFSTTNSGNETLRELEFETLPNSPPIDPNKIYYLSEFYTEGQLDLELLQIEGTKEGWAKVIGDGVVIRPDDQARFAVNIGSQNYVLLENLTVKGGNRYAIFADNAHHIWIKGCDVSSFGRMPNDYRKGIGYYSEKSTAPYNYDSGIYLQRTGVVVIEECTIHSPVGKSNSWKYGHPFGPNAILVFAAHPEERYQGQTIIRNNRLFGTHNHRFNDVIEGRLNFDRKGGFVRDSAIYGNFIAYANDDLIEIDGGQQNVLVYRNDLTQGYTGISIAPNILGPSYIFQNYIHDLGDETGKEWTAIKAGGLMSKPGGLTLIMENLIVTNRNGIAASKVESDDTFWIIAKNNFIALKYYTDMVGLGIYDRQKYFKSHFENNIIYNQQLKASNLNVLSDSYTPHPLTEDSNYIMSLLDTPSLLFPVEQKYLINNISRISSNSTILTSKPKVNLTSLRRYSNQTKYGTAKLLDDNTIYLEGNIWQRANVDYTITSSTKLTLKVAVDGPAEIVGIGFENDDDISENRIINVYGSQRYGIDRKGTVTDGGNEELTIPIGSILSGRVSQMVFILDNDKASREEMTTVRFSEILLFDEDTDLTYDIKVGL